MWQDHKHYLHDKLHYKCLLAHNFSQYLVFLNLYLQWLINYRDQILILVRCLTVHPWHFLNVIYEKLKNKKNNSYDKLIKLINDVIIIVHITKK